MSTPMIAGIILTALIVGLIANHFVRPFAKTEVQGVKLETLTGPIVSVTVLLLAFTLVTVYQSFLRGQTAAAEEARKVDYQFEMAQLLTEPDRQLISSATTCYASAVANYEWTSMQQGRTAPEVSPWTRQMRAGILSMTQRDEVPSSVMSALLTADRDRGESRSRRLTEAQPSVPIELKILLVITASFAVLVLATFTLGSVNRRVQIGVLTVLATVFIAFLAVITDLDRPYDGMVSVGPTDITRVAGDLREDYLEAYPAVPLPCDETGRKVD
jgi:uncharacterized membrane protein (DUF485 family)